MKEDKIREIKAPYVVDPSNEAIGRDTIIIQREGEPIAVIVPYDEYKSLKDREGPSEDVDHEFRKQWLAFQRLKPDLLDEHQGQWVAIVDERVAAVGSDFETVSCQIDEEYGDVPQCISQVLKTPRLVRMTTRKVPSRVD